MEYQDFLFSQLFMEYVNNNDTNYKELAYDIVFCEVMKHKELFTDSNFNIDILSEYECILNYLQNTIKTN